MNEGQAYNNDELETGVSEDAFEQDPVLAQYQNENEQAKWLDELTAARKERQKFDRVAAETIKRYGDENSGEASHSISRYNLFASNTDMKLAALYAQTPVPSVKRRFDDANDDVARVAGYIVQRLITYELECSGFDAKFKQTLYDWKVPGIGVNWVRFEQSETEPSTTLRAAVDPMSGMPITDPSTGHPVMQEVPVPPQIINQSAEIDYVAWNDFYWSPCTVWSMCRWVGRRVPINKDAVKERFQRTAPADVLDALSFAKPTVSNRTDNLATVLPQNQTEATLDVYELWDKERKVTFWIAEGASVPLDVQGDVCEFEGFFPTALPPLGRFDTANAMPISDYKLVQNQYRELDNLNTRAANLARALKLRWMYDGANKDLATLFTETDELEGVPVDNWSMFASEKGGLAGSVMFTPLSETVQAYQGILSAREGVKAQIFEIEGISDIARAASMPYESAEAVSVKAQFGSSRLTMDQRQVADYIARTLRLKAHLICKLYTPEIILKRVGIIPEADQELVQPAIQLLKDAQANYFRLEVSTESIELPNWNQKTTEKAQVIQAIGQMAQQIGPLAAQAPELVPFLAQMTKWGIAGMKGTAELEGYLDKAIDQLERAQSAQQGQPRPPTPEELKAQAAQQSLQTQAQTAATKAQAAVQVAQIQSQTKTEIAGMQAQLDQFKQNSENEFRQMELAIKAMNAKTAQTEAVHNTALDVAQLGGA